MQILNKVSIYYFVIAFLLSLYVLGIFTFGIQQILLQAMPAILATTISGSIFDYFELKVWSIPLTPLITGLIIGLVAQFGASPPTLISIGFSSMLIKFIVKWEGKHIFNPAGAGLLIGMILGSYPSWWTGGENIWIYIIWIPILLYKMKRWTPMVGFLIPVFLTGGITILTSSSVLFFLSVMLIEPKTSPATVKLGLVYGLIVAVSYVVIDKFFQFDPLILSLLISNLTWRVLARYSII